MTVLFMINPQIYIEDLQKVDVKNVIGWSLIIAGLILTMSGFNIAGEEVVTKTINGMETPLRSMDGYQWNWRAFMGLGAFFTGFGLWFFPSMRVIETGSGRH